MQYRIGVFGSAVKEKDEIVAKAKALGQELGRRQNIIIVNGACTGLPYIASYAGAKAGLEVWGFSPAKNAEEHLAVTPGDDVSVYKNLFFVPKEFASHYDLQVCRKYRNVTSTANCDGRNNYLKVIFDPSPTTLVISVLKELNNRRNKK